LDNIDTTAAWRVDTERQTMDSIPNWLVVDPKEVVIAGEGEPEVEKEDQQ